MKSPSDSAKEQQSRSSGEMADHQPSNSTQIYGNDLAEVYEDDLYKHQWIPLAIIATFLLIAAACIFTLGGTVFRSAVPSQTPAIVSETVPSPIPASPTATETTTPTPAATATVRVPVVLRVLPNAANVRSAPSLSARLVGQLKKGSLANPLFVSPDGRWFLVISQETGITGWVANELFETASGDSKALPTVASTTP